MPAHGWMSVSVEPLHESVRDLEGQHPLQGDDAPRPFRSTPRPLGLATFLSYFEDTTGALYAFCVMVLAPGLLVFLVAQRQFIQGLTSGATKG